MFKWNAAFGSNCLSTYQQYHYIIGLTSEAKKEVKQMIDKEVHMTLDTILSVIRASNSKAYVSVLLYINI